jgi:hypothetical protein
MSRGEIAAGPRLPAMHAILKETQEKLLMELVPCMRTASGD